MDQIISQLKFKTQRKGFTPITKQVNEWITLNKFQKGVLFMSLLHTSCSLIINENADPNVLKDLSRFFDSLIPEEGFKSLSGNGSLKTYLHNDEGPDDMPAHIRTVLTHSNLSLSVEEGKLILGIWQGIYIWEHRELAPTRDLTLHAIGEFQKK